MSNHPASSIPFNLWMRRIASVPRGILRFYVLKLLNEKAMSGSEIIEEVERETGGRWKPSPGSIYPLLSRLKNKGYIELSSEEEGMKHYVLTKKGQDFLKKHTKFGKKLRTKLEFLAPLLFGGFWLSPYAKELREIRDPIKRFVRAALNLRKALEENLTESTLREVSKALNDTTEKFERTCERIRR